MQSAGCGGEHGSHQLLDIISSADDGSLVVLVCTQVDPAISGTTAGIQAELQQLQQAHAAVAGTKKKHTTVYAVKPHLPAVQARQLMSRQLQADYTTCDDLCQVTLDFGLVARSSQYCDGDCS